MASNQKHCDYTFALSDLTQCERVKLDIYDFPIFAYIKHEPDSDNGSEHYHFYIHLTQPISIKNLSEKLDIPPHMIEWVRVKTRMIQYLIHKNNPEKKQYREEDIITNNKDYIHSFLDPQCSKVDLHSEVKDFHELACGHITIDEFISRHSDSIASLPFYSRSTYLMRLFNLTERGNNPNRF